MVKFVGRHHELELLQDRLQSATRGRGQVVGIAGDAGLGKSRMIFEFRQSQVGQPGTYLEGHCYSYGTATPYLPVLDLLRASCGIGDSDTPEVIVDKVHAGLTTAGMDPLEASPYLLQVLGVKEGVDGLAALSPEAIKARVFETLRQMSLRQSRQNPLIIVLSNSTGSTARRKSIRVARGEPSAVLILLVSTYRPGYRPP
jgi:predicted ATPase